jgi:predicted DNA-binding protein with PD1-like motif
MAEVELMVFPSDDEKAALVRLMPGADLLAELNKCAKYLGMRAGTLSVVGAVQNLVVAYFDQAAKKYRDFDRYDTPMEISGGVGNVSMKDGEPFVHIHITGAAADGTIVAGHLMEGTKVYMIEAYFRVLEGEAPVREPDDELGLPVWH